VLQFENDAAYSKEVEAAKPVYPNTYSPHLRLKARYMIYVSYMGREIRRVAEGEESKQFVG
jgi:hypothetical protein